jgi:ribonuclease-3
MDRTPYIDFAKEKLGVVFNDIELLVTAFTHRSYVNEHKKTVSEHNERLEFLGDAVLELVVTEYLYGNFSEPEGILTNWRSALVRTESIGAAAARYDAAKKFITEAILTTFAEILKTGSWMDPKSHLQEVVQSREGFTPVYRVLEEVGPDHDKMFTVGVFVGDNLRGQGQGPSKQAGQQKAAEAALIYYADK